MRREKSEMFRDQIEAARGDRAFAVSAERVARGSELWCVVLRSEGWHTALWLGGQDALDARNILNGEPPDSPKIRSLAVKELVDRCGLTILRKPRAAKPKVSKAPKGQAALLLEEDAS